MNNNIQEDYCSFEVSKLLKEKGFDVKGNNAYTVTSDGKCSGRVSSVSYKYIESISAIYKPTHALAIKWLRENFGIHIHLYYLNENTLWGWDCYKYKEENGLYNDPGYSWKLNHQSYESAVDAALLYILKNLI